MFQLWTVFHCRRLRLKKEKRNCIEQWREERQANRGRWRFPRTLRQGFRAGREEAFTFVRGVLETRTAMPWRIMRAHTWQERNVANRAKFQRIDPSPPIPSINSLLHFSLTTKYTTLLTTDKHTCRSFVLVLPTKITVLCYSTCYQVSCNHLRTTRSEAKHVWSCFGNHCRNWMHFAVKERFDVALNDFETLNSICRFFDKCLAELPTIETWNFDSETCVEANKLQKLRFKIFNDSLNVETSTGCGEPIN